MRTSKPWRPGVTSHVFTLGCLRGIGIVVGLDCGKFFFDQLDFFFNFRNFGCLAFDYIVADFITFFILVINQLAEIRESD